ncbi:hypothetical protein EV127DRAFT_502594 [Xylaria flabelliformis]|nr:hypothetical protein EV127DRAFT_502594 [Xylaria flabelliformis]
MGMFCRRPYCVLSTMFLFINGWPPDCTTSTLVLAACSLPKRPSSRSRTRLDVLIGIFLHSHIQSTIMIQRTVSAITMKEKIMMLMINQASINLLWPPSMTIIVLRAMWVTDGVKVGMRVDAVTSVAFVSAWIIALVRDCSYGRAVLARVIALDGMTRKATATRTDNIIIDVDC